MVRPVERTFDHLLVFVCQSLVEFMKAPYRLFVSFCMAKTDAGLAYNPELWEMPIKTRFAGSLQPRDQSCGLGFRVVN